MINFWSIVVSPKNNLLFIDNLLYKYSDLEKNFFEIFEPFNQDNFDYDINVYTHNDNLIIIENNKFYSLYDMFTNEIKILRNKLPSNKYINILNNSIFLLNNKNEIILINSITSNTFWISNIDKYLNKKNQIIKVIESNNYINIFLDNGNIIKVNSNNGTIQNINKLKINGIKKVYFHDNYILFITKKAGLHLYK